MRDIRALKSEADYDWALAEIERYFDREPKPGTPEAERFDVLADLIEAYEARHWAIPAPDPVAALVHKMEEAGLKRADLGKLLGSRSRATEVLDRRRPLTLDMVRKLNAEWRIPAEILIQDYRLSKPAQKARKRTTSSARRRRTA